jgi:nucleoside-diphosphate-sugar epimerase
MFMAPDSAHTRSTVDAAMRGVFALPGDADSFISFVHVEDAATAVIAALQAPAGTYNVAETDPVRRALHRRALAEAVGRDDLDTPAAVANGNPLARSHRVSSQRLRDVSSWAPTIRCVDRWKELR